MPKYLLILTACLLVAADAPKSDQEAIQGTWSVVQGGKAGKKYPAELVNNLRITFAGDKIVLRVKADTQEGTFELDPSGKPKQITITNAKGQAARGIYLLNKDKLYLCVAPLGKDRPTGFNPPPGDNCETFELSRGEP